MKTIEQWFDDYSVSHKNYTNQIIHFLCVPLIMFSVFGILWSLPQLPIFNRFEYLNWATLFYAACLLFYTLLDRLFGLIMAVVAGIMLLGVYYLSQKPRLMAISLCIFILAWIGQFIGHKIEGKKPSFFQDLQFLLIGPLWVVEEIFEIKAKKY